MYMYIHIHIQAYTYVHIDIDIANYSLPRNGFTPVARLYLTPKIEQFF